MAKPSGWLKLGLVLILNATSRHSARTAAVGNLGSITGEKEISRIEATTLNRT